MNDADYNELLERAKVLMAERDASIAPAALPGILSMLGRTLSYETPVSDEASASAIPRRYPGDLLLSGGRVTVVPFGVMFEPYEYFMAPTINNRSIFESSPPTLARRSGGAAVYIESVFEIYYRGTPSVDYSDVPYNAKLVACNIVDRPLGEPYPVEKGILAVTVPSNTWSLVSSEAKAYRLLGVYNRSGRVYNQTILGFNTDWYYQNVELENGDVIPPTRPAALRAPIKYEITFDY